MSLLLLIASTNIVTSTNRALSLPSIMQIKSFILSATSLCLMSAPVIADSGYYSSCNSVNVYRKDTQPNKGRPDIIGNCRKITGIYSVDTAINIDSCFANNGGNLVARLKCVSGLRNLWPTLY